MTVDYNAPAHDYPTTKKALLVGISYRNQTTGNGQVPSWGPIPTSLPNVRMFKKFIQDTWGYTDIVVMTDEDGVEEGLRPTMVNLKHQIETLRRGVEPGDRLLFYFTGHSSQLPCRSGTEEDGMDETLVPLDGCEIKDNDLHEWLVKDLPQGAALTAIFDSCNSGTMLDLKHYKCNSVYYPWVNKGTRGSKSLCNTVARRDGKMTRSEALSQPRSRMGSGEGDFPSHSIFGTVLIETPQLDEDPDKHSGRLCMSPAPEREFCDGWCRDKIQRKGSLPQGDVISISSSNDGQISWDVTKGGDVRSMTSCLIKVLEQRPKMTYSELMTRLNHEVHSYTRDMHRDSREKRRARRAGGTEPGDEGEMDNFQDLQLGSMTLLDMKRIFEL